MFQRITITLFFTGSPLHSENGIKEITVSLLKHRENRNFIFPCEFPKTKEDGYCDLCHEILNLFLKNLCVFKVSFACETVPNRSTWHKENL